MTPAEILNLTDSVRIYRADASVYDTLDGGNGASTNKDNWVAVALGVTGGAIGFAGIAYGGWRLHRYRPKYHEEKARAEAAEQVLHDMAG